MKQTAVEWLMFEKVLTGYIDDEMVEKALEMEKEQIIHAYGQGVADEVGEVVDATKDAEQYYNQKYKSK